MEEGGERRTERFLEEILAVLFIIFILLQIFGNLPGFVSKTFGGDGNFIARTLGLNPPLTAETPIGTAVVNTKEATVHAEPGGEVIGTQPKGAEGIVVGGPVLRDGTLWWQVEYEDGTVGWVSEDDLAIDLERDQKILKESTPHGTRVETIEETDIFSSPTDGLVVGRQRVGDKGTIVGGPVEVDGERWWQVKYADGTVGWVPESSLQIDVPENRKAITDATTLGTEILAARDLDVWSLPRGGTIIGQQLKGAIGELVDGSVTIGTTRWWEVDFRDEPDGWVKEEDLERRFPGSEAASAGLAFLKRLSFIFSTLLFVGVIYVFIKLNETYKREHQLMGPLSIRPQDKVVRNDRWKRVLDHLESDNPNDWRLAILEADIMLDDMVEQMYLPGDTLGERLKAVERSDFETIDQAWEAHKVRNKLAHEGGDYILTQREAKRVVALYKKVFDEFHMV